MAATSPTTSDDPRKLRALFARASGLAGAHDVPSVMAGLTADPSDRCFVDFVDFLESALRVEDGIFRMTRDRVVLHLADVELKQAAEVVERLLGRFQDEFPQFTETKFQSRYAQIRPGEEEPTIKEILPTLFVAKSVH